MTIHEPMTLATDFLMGAFALAFAARLWGDRRPWALAFAFTAAASFLGGAYHGVGPLLTPLAASVLWKITVFSVGLASFFLLWSRGRLLATIGMIKLVLYLSWMTVHDDFVWVIADYGLTLVLLGVEQATGWIRSRVESAPWILASIGVSVAGALVQQSGIVFHRHFNHNDLYHLIQIVALWLLFRGARLATTPATNRSPVPT